MTAYTVLRQIPRSPDSSANGAGDWKTVGSPVEAASADAAIRKVAKEAGTYAAVPARSFKPVRVTVETPAPVVKLGDVA